MSYSVIIEDRAKRDIREAARWMAQYSPQKATLWHFEIEEAILSLSSPKIPASFRHNSGAAGALILLTVP